MTVWVVVCQVGEQVPIVYLYGSKEPAMRRAVELGGDPIVSRHARISLLRETIS